LQPKICGLPFNAYSQLEIKFCLLYEISSLLVLLHRNFSKNLFGLLDYVLTKEYFVFALEWHTYLCVCYVAARSTRNNVLSCVCYIAARSTRNNVLSCVCYVAARSTRNNVLSCVCYVAAPSTPSNVLSCVCYVAAHPVMYYHVCVTLLLTQ
jgi:hypothetical protein